MRLNRRFIIFIIIATVFVALFLRYLYRAPKRHYSDFRVYHATGRRFIERQNIYERPDQSITPFKYSPICAMLMAPLSFFSRKTASLVFFTINFILLIVAFIFSGRLIIRDKMSFKEMIFLYIFPALFTLRFILLTLDCGQVGIIIFALIVLGLYFLREKKDMLTGALMGLSIMFKYTPAVFLPYFIFKNKVKLVILIMIFIMLYCVIPATYTGMDKQIDSIKNWFPFITETSFYRGSWYDNKNQSLFSLVLRYFTKDSPYRVSVAGLTFNQGLMITFILGTVIYLLIIFPGKDYDFRRPVEYSLLFIFMVLFNPNAWMHNFVAFIFAYMTLFYYLIKVNFKDKITLALVALSFTLMTLMSETFVGDNLETLSEELSSVTIGALILMFLLFRLKFLRWGNNS
ncbi:MAG: DUF2029 domain-containing protein [Candidatus Omnitrophota bacterium]|nr:MAG: DUF2029 domain-containing protein [Candidatus Omnitrophota bacterium]